MTRVFDKLSKLRGRGFRELGVRGRQTLTAYAENLGLLGGLPDDREFWRLVDRQKFDQKHLDSAAWLRHWVEERGEAVFFPAFADQAETVRTFRRAFGEQAQSRIVERAEKILIGKFDLQGYSDLDFGTPVDWHCEPLSGRRMPLRHWRQINEVDIEELGDVRVVWELNRHQYFFTLGAAYWFTNDERYAARFVMHLTGWMQQNPPGTGVNWVSSLELAFRAISWLWALHFFKKSPNLTASIFGDALKFLYLHGRHIETHLSTYFSPNTHLTGEALGLYYLGTLLPEFKRAKRWRATGKRILIDELDRQILPDGVYFEQSTWYARYTADFYTHFLILDKFNRDDLTIAEAEKLNRKLLQLHDFLLHATRPDGTTPVIGDDDGGQFLPLASERAANDFRPTLTTAATLWGRSDYKFVAGRAAEETLWLLGGNGLRRFDELNSAPPAETSKAFRDGGYCVMRDGWAHGNSDYLIVDGGYHGVLNCGHAHADALSFELAVNGQNVFVDPGTYTYRESPAARNRFRRSAAHNTLTVDGASSSEPGGLFQWQTTADAATDKWFAHRRFDFFAGSHNGFSRFDNGNAAPHTRSVLWLKNDFWIVRDLVEIAGDHRCRLHFHLAADLRANHADGGNAINVTNEDNDQLLQIVAFADGGEWQVQDDFVSPRYGLKVPATTLEFAAGTSGAAEFTAFLLPYKFGRESTRVEEIKAANGRGFCVETADKRDVLLFASNGGQPVAAENIVSDFRCAWMRFSAATNRLEELIVIGGRQLTVMGKDVFGFLKTTEYAVGRRTDNRLRVEMSGDIAAFDKLIDF